MKRIQLFEFEDFNWFPEPLRRAMTNLIIVLHKMVGTKEVIAGLIEQMIKKGAPTRIVDMGSGSGGIIPDVMKYLNKEYKNGKFELILTDLYPNQKLIRKIKAMNNDWVSYYEKPVDATEIGNAPEGLKTMINCFHHMKPDMARKILRSAQEMRQPILIYEMGENNIPLLLWWILLPLSLSVLFIMAVIMTFWVRPLGWQQIVFTFLIPVIPICYAWDGQASLPRMYTMDDLELLLEELPATDYEWSKGKAFKKNGKKLGTYVMGLPTK